ncbi:hypothetical protein L3Y34_005841 [Caenorhabditis briggsae]|uniref:RING-type E3 ubiquitin transferase n=1 Tax=Caenorhabditis briggsae TaxID=6238 RepID=A0AAE9CY36_CAEBR|nr:hypothetical protein L3Y34_005841 [Caenorhabditis briggsae]
MQRNNPLPREFPVEPLFGDEHLDPRAWNGVVPNVHPAPEEPHSLQLEPLIFGDVGEKLGELAETVTCPICTNILTSPVTTSCRHTVCNQCLASHAAYQLAVGVNNTCPCCRTSILNNSVNPSPKTEALINAILVSFTAPMDRQMMRRRQVRRPRRQVRQARSCSRSYSPVPDVMADHGLNRRRKS